MNNKIRPAITFLVLALTLVLPISCSSPEEEPDPDPRTTPPENEMQYPLPERSNNPDNRPITELTEQITSDNRENRVRAARALVRRVDEEGTRAVIHLLLSGSERSRTTLINVLENILPEQPGQVMHLGQPFFIALSEEEERSASFRNALFLFPPEHLSEYMVKAIETLEADGGNGTRAGEVRKKQARILRFARNHAGEFDVRETVSLLLEPDRDIPGVLSPEVTSLLQVLCSQYQLHTRADWKEWWQEHRGKSEIAFYRVLLQQQSRQKFEDWKETVERLLSNNPEAQTDQVLAELQQEDIRFRIHMIKRVRDLNLPEEGNARIAEAISTFLNPRTLTELRLETLRTLRSFGNIELADETVVAMETGLTDVRPEIRREAAKTLGTHGDRESARKALDQFFREGNPDIRQILVESINALEYREAAEPLAKFLIRDEMPDMGVHQTIMKAISNLGNREVIPLLTEYSNRSHMDDSPSLRIELTEALGGIGHPDGIPLLIEFTRDPNVTVRQLAAGSIGDVSFEGDSERRQNAHDRLLELVSDREEEFVVRREAARSLSILGTAETVSELLDLLDYEDDELHERVRNTVRDILFDRYPDYLLETIQSLQNRSHHDIVVFLGNEYRGRREDLDLSEDPDIQFHLARSFLSAGEWTDTLDWLDGLEEELPDRVFAIFIMRIEAYRHLDNFERVEEQLNTLASNHQDQPAQMLTIELERARLDVARGRPNRALDRLEELEEGDLPTEDREEEINQLRNTIQSRIDRVQNLVASYPGADEEERQSIRNRLSDRELSYIAIEQGIEELRKTIEGNGEEGNESFSVSRARALNRLLQNLTGQNQAIPEEADREVLREILSNWQNILEEQFE